MPRGTTKVRRAAPIPVILKPSARGTEQAKIVRRIEELFRARGAEARILRLDSAGRVPRLSGGRKLGTVVAAGGDGTVATVAAKLVGTERSLGVLPLGTFNHFAKDAGIPLNLEDAVDVILAGRVRRIDVGKVNGRVFLNNSSIGLYPEIVRRREKRERLGLGKMPAFALAMLRTLQRSPLLDIELRVEGRTIAHRTPGIFFGNNVYVMQGLRMGERKRLDEGRLSIYLVHATGSELLQLMGRALLGSLRYDPEIEAAQARSAVLSVRRRRRIGVAADGEISRMKLPLRYRILPLALRVLVARAPRKRGTRSPRRRAE